MVFPQRRSNRPRKGAAQLKPGAELPARMMQLPLTAPERGRHN